MVFFIVVVNKKKKQIGVDFLSKRLHFKDLNKTITLELWDIGSQEAFGHMRRIYLRDTDALVFVYKIEFDIQFIEFRNKKWLKFLTKPEIPLFLIFNMVCKLDNCNYGAILIDFKKSVIKWER